MKLAVIGLTTFLASISLAQDVVNEKAGNSIKVDTRAPSTYQNCKCQCDSYTWSDGNYIRGNCRSKAKLPGPSQATGLFCYVSGSALCSCRDVQRSNSVVDSFGNLRYYSFEACTTPPRNQCTNYGWGSYGGNGGNYGDGGFPYCSNSGSNSGSNQGWSSGSSNSNQGWSSGSSNSNQGGQVGPPTQIIGQEGPQVIDPVGLLAIDLVGLPAIDLVGHPVIDLVDHHLATDPVAHPAIDPVIVLV